MTLELRRIILFTPRLAEMAEFYSNVLGLKVTGDYGDAVGNRSRPQTIQVSYSVTVIGTASP